MLALVSALWLGILTSISPCPLASNIAAISFLSKKINHPKDVMMSGIAYTLGRVLTYTVIGILIITSLAGVPVIAKFLQKYMNIILGPLLIVVGLFLLEVFKFSFSGLSLSHEKQTKLADSGLKGAFVLGVVFALSFCPISAGLFFGSLIPLALNNNFGVIFPVMFGIGTGLPVILFALAVAFGFFAISHLFKRLTEIEKYTRKITGGIFVIVGAYFIWNYIIVPLL
ncbi:MAG: aromatic aminobenezylarsenical efflux permease ArsG family transporter [Candidatus Zapsychrus exili]|nr:aromatic aminobenezylarsenical efflux permease ArsG family transporter [Candidatus Zapsychrus exili]